MDKVDEAFEKVQAKHLEWFKSRPPRLKNRGYDHDRLEDHCFINNDQLTSYPWSDLPDYILQDLVNELKGL